MRRVVWGVQDAAHLSRPSLVVSEQQSQVKTIIFFCKTRPILYFCLVYIPVYQGSIECLVGCELVVALDKDDKVNQSCSGEELRHPQPCHWPALRCPLIRLPVKVDFLSQCSAHLWIRGLGKQPAKWKTTDFGQSSQYEQ